MANRKFSSQLKELLASFDKDEKITATQLIQKAKEIRNPNRNEGVIEVALTSPRFVRKIIKAYRRSVGGRVVIYTRKGTPNAMTFEQMSVLQETAAKARVGLKKYHAARRAAAV